MLTDSISPGETVAGYRVEVSTYDETRYVDVWDERRNRCLVTFYRRPNGTVGCDDTSVDVTREVLPLVYRAFANKGKGIR